MTKLFYTLIFLFTFTIIFCQERLPNLSLKNLKGDLINLSELENNGKPIVINFWSTYCSPCKRELNCINELYPEWIEETGVKIYAISIDDQRTIDRVKPLVYANNWEYEILYDHNGDLRRSLGVNTIPFTLLLDGNGVIVWKHNNYNPGDEEELYKKLKEVSK
jgi:cytochrome c biogenesis protein CcmG/thiol:disulfide interchange protein DsbE